jgi:hypothetical protein
MTLDEYNAAKNAGITTFNVSYVNTYSGLGDHRLFQRGTYQVAGDVLIFPDHTVLVSPVETYDPYIQTASIVIRGANGTQTIDSVNAQYIVDAGYVEVLSYTAEAYDNGKASTNFTGAEVIDFGLSNTNYTSLELITGGVA